MRAVGGHHDMEERMTPIVTISDMPLAAVHGADDGTVRWAGGFAAYGGSGANDSAVVYYEIAPGGRLGWHTDSTEEIPSGTAGWSVSGTRLCCRSLTCQASTPPPATRAPMSAAMNACVVGSTSRSVRSGSPVSRFRDGPSMSVHRLFTA